ACDGEPYHSHAGGPASGESRGWSVGQAGDGPRPTRVATSGGARAEVLSELLPELSWRGVIEEQTPGLERRLASERPIGGYLDFLRKVGKHFTVPYMLDKESVQARLAGGLSFTEFSYMLLQAADFRHLYRHLGVELQMGGADQWGNITAGLELIRRSEAPSPA